MNLGTYGILIVFAAFIVLLILNPKLSCFGKRIRSPFYPVLGKRQKKEPSLHCFLSPSCYHRAGKKQSSDPVEISC